MTKFHGVNLSIVQRTLTFTDTFFQMTRYFDINEITPLDLKVFLFR